MCEDVELSERRGHVKWSQDPRNVLWSSDKSKFGFRMLEKMGWAEGKGLGINEDGTKQHVKVSVKNEKLGLGAKRSQNDDWIEQQSSFESLLADLNAVKEPNKDKPVADLACAATKSRKLVYRKFLKSKNLSCKAEEDMNCVLGKRKKSEDKSDQTVTCTKEDHQYTDSSGITVIKSDVSLEEYFSKKKRDSLQDKTSSGTGDVSTMKKRKTKKQNHTN